MGSDMRSSDKPHWCERVSITSAWTVSQLAGWMTWSQLHGGVTQNEVKYQGQRLAGISAVGRSSTSRGWNPWQILYFCSLRHRGSVVTEEASLSFCSEWVILLSCVH
jgi:hypothetical protein